MSCGCQDKNNQINNAQNSNMNIQLRSPLRVENMMSQNMSIDQAIQLYRQGHRVEESPINTNTQNNIQPLQSFQPSQPFQPTVQQLQTPIQSLATNDDPSILLAFVIGVIASLTAIYISKKWMKF